MLPIALRNQMQPILKDGFYIKKSYYKECLELYPAKEWEKVMGELDEKNRYDEEVDDFIRIFTAGIAPIRKHLEIWDLEVYEKAVIATKERKKELAGKVMLGKTKEDVS